MESAADLPGLGGERLANATAHEFAELKNRGVGHGVEDLEAVFTAGYEPGGSESLEMTRDIGLGATSGLD